MAYRIRYLVSSTVTRKDLLLVTDGLVQNQYLDGMPWGFVDVRNEGNAVAGTFIERFEAEDRVEDPFGEVTTYKRIHFNQTKFRLGLELPQLEVYDAPRSFIPLLNELSRSIEFKLAFSTLRINLQEFIASLTRQTSSLTVNAVNLRDISLTTDVFARVSVLGSGEVRPHLKAASLGKRVVIEKVSIIGTVSSGGFKLDAASDARICLQTGYWDEITGMLRTAIAESMENGNEQSL